jgi:hypothetical protein
MPGEFVIMTATKFKQLYAVNGGGRASDAFTTIVDGLDAGVAPFARFKFWSAGLQDIQYKFITTAKGYSFLAPDRGGHATSDAVATDLNGLPYGQYVPLGEFRFGRMDHLGESTIQTKNGDFVTAVGGGGQLTNALHTDAKVARSWEQFLVLKCGDLGSGLTYAISNHEWRGCLTATGGGGKTEQAIKVGEFVDSARFTFIRQAGGSYALRTVNGINYVTAVGGGWEPFSVENGSLHTDATQVQAWERFKIVDEGRCLYSIQTSNGGFLGFSPGDSRYFATNYVTPEDNPGASWPAKFYLYMFDL